MENVMMLKAAPPRDEDVFPLYRHAEVRIDLPVLSNRGLNTLTTRRGHLKKVKEPKSVRFPQYRRMLTFPAVVVDRSGEGGWSVVIKPKRPPCEDHICCLK